MTRIGRVTLTAFALTAMAFGQEQQQQPALGEAKPLIDAMAAIGSIIAGADKTGEDPAVPAAAVAKAEASTQARPADTTLGYEAPAADKKADGDGQPAAVKKPRSTRNSVILVTSGAAAGAAIGASMGKGQKGAMIGAAVGGAVGLVYDRMTHKNPGKI